MSTDAEQTRRARISATLKGRPKSAETRQRMSDAARQRSQEHRDRLSAALRGKKLGQPAQGFYISAQGYRVLTGQHDHPLAMPTGDLLEHRSVLFSQIAAGPHLCHWGCGRSLEWGGIRGIIADHLDGDPLNNDPANLVPSCNPCNAHRGN